MNLPRTPMKRVVVGALLISLAVGALHLFACWLSFAPHGSDFLYKSISLICVTYLVLLAFINALYLIAQVVGLLFGWSKATWQGVGASAAFFAIVFVLMFVIMGVGEGIRYAGYHRITLRGAPLVVAIKQYQAAHGAPPDTLDALVPECLPAIPNTGVAAYPSYEFIKNRNPKRFGGNRWVLSVDVSTDDLMHDALLFYPDGKYPPPGTLVRRFGNWALISTPVKSGGSQN